MGGENLSCAVDHVIRWATTVMTAVEKIQWRPLGISFVKDVFVLNMQIYSIKPVEPSQAVLYLISPPSSSDLLVLDSSLLSPHIPFILIIRCAPNQ